MHESLPLATIHDEILNFLRNRDDAVVIGAQAVNAYVDEPRMTQDIDILSTRADELADELRAQLSSRFHIEVRVRELGEGRGYRVYQLQQPRNRHLADIRPVEVLPASDRIAGILIPTPAQLIASKVVALHRRRGQPKSGTDWRDIALLLLKFPELKSPSGLVRDGLIASNAPAELLALWDELASQQIQPEDDADQTDF